MDRKEREEAVDWFCERMKETLRLPKNEAKGSWRENTMYGLLKFHEREHDELQDAIYGYAHSASRSNVEWLDDIVADCCDAAAFLMMIADVARRLRDR